MRHITITERQFEFINRAIELKEAVINFEQTGEEFKKRYGISKKAYIKEIEDLENELY